MGLSEVRVAPTAHWARMVVFLIIAGVLAYGCTRIFELQPALGALLLGAVGMAAAKPAAWPGAALMVGGVAMIWNGLAEFPHAIAGFLWPALLVELWAARWRSRPHARTRSLVATDLTLVVLTLGSPVGIGFLAGDGYVYVDDVVEFRRYIVDLTSIGLAYLGVIGATAAVLGDWIRKCHVDHRRRKAHTIQLTA